MATIVNHGIIDGACVYYTHMVADGAARGTGVGYRLLHHALESSHHGLVITVLDHERRQLAVQFTQQQQVTIAHLVEDGDGVALAIIRLAVSVDSAHVGDIAAVADGHVVQVVADILDQAVVADSHVAQRGIVDAAVLHKAFGNLYCSASVTQTRPAIKLHSVTTARIKIGRHLNFIPVLCPTVIPFQGFDLLVGQLEVFFHVLDILQSIMWAQR